MPASIGWFYAEGSAVRREDRPGSLAEKDRLTAYLQVVLEYDFQASEHVEASDVSEAFEKIPQREKLMPTIAEKLRQDVFNCCCSKFKVFTQTP